MRILLLCVLLGGCTSASMTLPDGTRLKYFDLHPGGNAVKAKGIWQGVGSFEIDRETESSDEVVEAVTDGLTNF